MPMTTAELGALALFEDCAPDDLRPVADAITGEVAAVEGDVICVEGDKADRWWIVLDGTADVTASGIYIGTIGPGETIGELALLDGEPRTATVKAVTDMRLVEVAGDAFLDGLAAQPRLALALLRQLAGRLRERNRFPAAASASIRPASRAPSSAPDAAAFDPAAPGFFDDPISHYAACREAAPVQWSEVLSSYLVTRYDDVFRLSRSRALIGSVTVLDAVTNPRPGQRMMINRDGDDHLRLRRLVSRVFTPRAVSLWRERAEAIVESLLAAATERDGMDVISDYALQLPAQVITEMLGLPEADTPQLREWSGTLAQGLDVLTLSGEQDRVQEAGRAIGDYLQAVIDDKRRAPADDILSALLLAEDAGDVLDDREVVAQVLLLYIAGHETTLNLIGNGLTHLFRFPEQLAGLRAEPGLDANAIEELLRYDSPAQLTRRINLEAVEIDGTSIPTGSHLTLALASANHDPRKWGPTADVIDVARPGANEHVSFGGGPHYCLGASLARMEAGLALPRLLRRFPAIAPAYDAPKWMRRVTLRGVESLPVTLR